MRSRTPTPDARSTPYFIGTQNDQHNNQNKLNRDDEDLLSSGTVHFIFIILLLFFINVFSLKCTDTNRSGQPDESTCSSAEIYKMKALGNPGDRSPTVRTT